MARTPLSEMVAAAKAAIEELSVEQLQALHQLAVNYLRN